MSHHLGLFNAAEKGNVARLRELLGRGADVNWANADKGGATPLLVAARCGQQACVEALLEVAGINVDQACLAGCTPLFAAAQGGHHRCIQAR